LHVSAAKTGIAIAQHVDDLVWRHGIALFLRQRCR